MGECGNYIDSSIESFGNREKTSPIVYFMGDNLGVLKTRFLIEGENGMTNQSLQTSDSEIIPSGTAENGTSSASHLEPNRVHHGDARHLLKLIEPSSVALSFWSPPYCVGKSYEIDLDFDQWSELLKVTIDLHYPVMKDGGFLAINVADILAFEDPEMPRIQANHVSGKKVKVTRDEVLDAQNRHPSYDKYQLAALLGCSEQTIDRRLKNNNVRGGKYAAQTKVKLTAGLISDWAESSGFYLYDRRVWVKDPCWANSRWHSSSYRSVDEWEHLLIFWKPGITDVNRERLTKEEWAEWGSRGVWSIPSVRSNSDHESQFPVELPRRAIRLLTEPGELVLDCFIGSGTTAVAAIDESRQFIGFDSNLRSVQMAENRIAEINMNQRGRFAF